MAQVAPTRLLKPPALLGLTPFHFRCRTSFLQFDLATQSTSNKVCFCVIQIMPIYFFTRETDGLCLGKGETSKFKSQ